MQLELEQLLNGDQQAFLRLLNVHFAQGRLFDLSTPTALIKHDEESLASQRQIASSWLYMQRASLAKWSKNSFHALVNKLSEHLAQQGLKLHPVLIVELRFSFACIDQLIEDGQSDAKVAVHLSILQPILLAYSIKAHDFWFSPHPIKKLFDMLYEQSLGLQEQLGKQADAEITVLSNITNQALIHSFESTQDLFNLMSDFRQQQRNARGRLNRLLDRLLESETGALKTQSAQEKAQQLLWDCCGEIKLPNYWLQFLHKIFLPEVKTSILQARDINFSELCQKLTNFFEKYQSSNIDLDSMMQLNVELESKLKSFFPEYEVDIDSLFSNVSSDLLQIETGLDQGTWQTYSDFSGGNEHVPKTISQPLLDKLSNFQKGQWFLLHMKSSSQIPVQRVQLLLKLEEFERYLFVNANGQKVLSVDSTLLAALLSSRKLQPLQLGSQLTNNLTRVLSRLLDEFEDQQEILSQKQLQEQQLAIKKEKIRQEKIRHSEAEKARLEAEAIAEEQRLAAVKLEQKEKEQAREALSADVLRKLRLTIDGLLIGAWIDFIEDGEVRRLKLAVKFAATNRFVFVNPEGITEMELQRDDLIDGVLSKTIVILETDQFFADRLNKLLQEVEVAEVGAPSG